MFEGHGKGQLVTGKGGLDVVGAAGAGDYLRADDLVAFFE